MFETKIFFHCRDLSKVHSNRFIVEGESRSIGKLSVPNNLFTKILSGENIWVELPIEERAKRLAVEYKDQSQNIIPKIGLLKKYLSSKVTEKIISSLEQNDFYSAAYLLLAHHYDTYYKKNSPENSKTRNYKAVFKSENFENLSRDVLAYLK